MMRENWLAIAVGVYLAGMILYGHYRGFIKIAVSAVALVLTLLVVHTVSPQVTGFIRNNTGICAAFENSMQKAAGLGETPEMEEPAAQRLAIEEMDFPAQLKRALLENNNNEVYEILGVKTFTQYVSKYLANAIINIISFLLVFVLVFTAIRILTVWLDLVARLPVLSGTNKIAGAILGGAEGLLFLWIACLFITAFSGTDIGRAVIHQIEESTWLSFLYNHNLLGQMVLNVVNSLI
ncbi:MAG: CvpA family protein [Clostridiaceae bacterium]|nr:CvpA family protein [Clostridiaceae bacterium]MDD6073636.1 CvpA family protein [Clostridium sp.]